MKLNIMEVSLKLFAFLYEDSYWVPQMPILTIAENEDQALLDFFRSEFLGSCKVLYCLIEAYGYSDRCDLHDRGIINISYWIEENIEKNFREHIWSYSILPPKHLSKIVKWVLQQWGIDIEDIDLSAVKFDSKDLNLIDEEVSNIIRTKIFELSDEKQLVIARFMINKNLIGFGEIREQPLNDIIGLSRLTKSYEDKMNQMRIDTAKVMRRNVSPELFDIIAKHLKSSKI